MSSAHDSRIQRHKHCANRELTLVTRALRGPTKEDIIRKCQYMLDQNRDNRIHMKCAQIDNEEWISLNFKRRRLTRFASLAHRQGCRDIMKCTR